MALVSEFPVITDEALAELRSRIGVEVSSPDPYLTEATRDGIRHWADGVGDRNRLWRDEEHAAASRWGGLVAPPTILYAFDRICSGYVGGLPGVHAMFAGTDFRWSRPVRVGDRLAARAHLAELVDRPSEFSGRAVQQIYRVTFKDQAGELICEADSWCFRTQRDVARERAKYEKVEPAAYTAAEIEVIAAEYGAEDIRGPEPRWFEDVAVGDELPTVLKGPLTVTSIIAFDQGWGGLYIRAHGLAFDMFDRHPALAIPNANSAPEPPERVHWDPDLAARVGVPGAYDYGPERISWLGHLMTNWIGDDGFLRRLNAQVRRHNLVGDLTRCSGRVIRKWEEPGARGAPEETVALVECEVEATNQRGEVTAKGVAVAELPSRARS
ncbi:MAG TPA: MaoC family dehydratase N-terminal domain-containing protein [Acidimicrobiia bacterium]